MRLDHLGEDALIKRLQSRFNRHLPETVLAGIGDDCAVTEVSETKSQLTTCDMLIEGVHFIKEQTTPEALGYKAIAVSLSDIAAMGGTPQNAFLSLGVPKEIDTCWLDRFFDGFEQLANQSGVQLLGGDLVCSSKIVINVLVLGKADTKTIHYRHLAKAGDIVCTTGFLGDAAGGLKLLGEGVVPQDVFHYLTNQLHRPCSHLKQGKFLGREEGVHAMIDISDGLAKDLKRIADASQLGAIVHLDQLPLSVQLQRGAEIMNWNLFELSACSGEDYCLLLTIDKSEFLSVSARYKKQFEQPLYQIGHMVEGSSSIRFLEGGEERDLPQGFDHFCNQEKG